MWSPFISLRHIYVNYHNRIHTEEQYLHLHKKPPKSLTSVNSVVDLINYQNTDLLACL